MGVRLVVRSSWSSKTAQEYVYEFDQGRVVVGRHKGSDVHVPHPAVSGLHATFRAEGARWVVIDEGSTNGTLVNSERLPPGRPKAVGPDDAVDIGGFRITLEVRHLVDATAFEKTDALARQIVREAFGAETEGPRLRVLNGPEAGRVVDLPAPPGTFVIGRGEDVDLPLSDEDLSREHVEVAQDLDGVVARDRGSKNGTLVNDRPITERRLKDGDEVRLGQTVLIFEDPAEHRIGDICAAPEEIIELPREPEPAAAVPAEEASSDHSGPSDGGDGVVAAKAHAPDSARPPSKPTRAQSGIGADVIIYLLAGTVLALSIAGLFMLLRAG